LTTTTFRVISVLQQDERALAGFFPMLAQQAAAGAAMHNGCVSQSMGGVYARSESSTRTLLSAGGSQ
jgi:hypothetical protein